MPTLREIRFLRGLRQNDLSSIANIDVRKISMIENNRYFPTEDEKRRLAGALNVPLQKIAFCECIMPYELEVGEAETDELEEDLDDFEGALDNIDNVGDIEFDAGGEDDRKDWEDNENEDWE